MSPKVANIRALSCPDNDTDIDADIDMIQDMQPYCCVSWLVVCPCEIWVAPLQYVN
jgi:hypothetical protein